ncbi:hypothetical protein ACIP6P_22940 [Streptomyces sp. NPDC088729]|uniref:hypothetical protein n=1 Tax=unclassified Streptomyces TaxID=2593676 RepID=UPI000F555B93|nr:hypothetical protein [Streptomyces sp. ADI96-02]
MTTRAQKAAPTSRRALLRASVGGSRHRRVRRAHHPHEARTVRRTLVSGQQPFALILGRQ